MKLSPIDILRPFLAMAQLTLVSAQTQIDSHQRFDSIFYDTAVKVSAIDIKRAGKIADSLYRTAETDLHRIKSLMLSADLLEKQGKRQEAITYVLRADSIVGHTDNFEWKARIYGFLSTQYRIIGLVDQGKRFLEKGLEASAKITPQSASDQYRGMVYQEMAHYALHGADYKEAIFQLKKVTPLFLNMKNEKMKNYFIGNNEEMLGRSYLALADHGAAELHYNKALDFLDKADAGDSQWAGMVFHGMGKIALKDKAYPKALVFLKKADTIATALDHTSLKELVYRDLGNYYKTKGDLERYSFYNTKYLQNVAKNIASEKAAANGAINRLVEEHRYGFDFTNKLLPYFIILLVGGGLLYFGIKRKKNRVQGSYIAQKIRPTPLEKRGLGVKVDPSTPLDGDEVRLMPLDTETELLKKLEKFENDNEFLNNNLSLALLSANLNTNTKYLSHIINKHKKKDFSSYINELRILYIVQKIKKDPNYHNYKISYLASECGFSSHSKFATVFRNTTGLTPSSFLHTERSKIVAPQ